MNLFIKLSTYKPTYAVHSLNLHKIDYKTIKLLSEYPFVFKS